MLKILLRFTSCLKVKMGMSPLSPATGFDSQGVKNSTKQKHTHTPSSPGRGHNVHTHPQHVCPVFCVPGCNYLRALHKSQCSSEIIMMTFWHDWFGGNGSYKIQGRQEGLGPNCPPGPGGAWHPSVHWLLLTGSCCRTQEPQT